MDWTAVEAPPEKVALMQVAIELIPTQGVSVRALSAASHQLFGDDGQWLQIFPGGLTEALWFVSDVSDGSMAHAFANAPAKAMPEVVAVRFAQNAALKPFVRRVMIYDFFHPFQALARMQRTAKVMFDCLRRRRSPSFLHLAALNLLYTFTVMIWLADRSPDNRLADRCARILLRPF